ncbi:MAG: ribosome biogenesis GTPase Der [Armatimonadetes bacterium]|nr:ribosome biogenesis GTPase Der [Armatimonadota bacterium]
MPKPLVAIVGRPNVGKSTLFNRLAGRRIAIVEDTPGITRDRLYADGDWRGREYTLIDTGGIQMFDPDPLKAQVRTQAEIAMAEADVIVFVVDTIAGLTADDFELATALRRSPKPLVVLANKVDNGDQEYRNVPEVYALGFPEVYPVSALGGRGVADALDAIVDHLPPPPPAPEEEAEDERTKIAIIGRPNVGKSSLLNAILGEERAIVSPVAGTTRDAVDTSFEFNGRELVLIDTAGIRRAGKIQGGVEYYTVLRALRAIERADVVMLVIDAIDGLTDGDKRVGGYAHEAGRAAVIVVNKWDAGRKDVLEEAPGKNPMKIFSDGLREQMPFMSYAPLAFTSALTGKGVAAAVDAALDAAENHAMRIPTGELNRLLRDAADAHPYNEKGRALKIYYATMPTVKPPTIVLFVNDPELMHFSYKRYLENRIRESYSFEGTPLRIDVRKAADKKEA